jgi:hypothetical protein
MYMVFIIQILKTLVVCMCLLCYAGFLILAELANRRRDHVFIYDIKTSLIVLADLPALVKWIKYTGTEVSEAGNVRVMLKDKQNLQKRLNAFLYCMIL